jgi:hypothetical protein
LPEAAATGAVKPALDWPPAIVTLAGTVTLGLLLERETVKPPDEAEPLSEIVHEELPGA